MSSCEKSFEILIKDLHNSCSMSNIIYLLTGVFGIVALQGWWRIIGLVVILEAIVSFINHSNIDVWGISSSIWNHMDVSLAMIGCIFTFILVIINYKKIPRRSIAICVAVFLVALVFLITSELAKKKKKDSVKSFGIGNPLAEQKIIPNYDEERHQALYLGYHTSWHIVSGMAILVMLIVLAPILNTKHNKS